MMRSPIQWHTLKRIHIRHFVDLPAQEFRITLPTMLTIFRIGLVPCIITAMVMHYWGLAGIFFLVASLTDCLDGGLARLLHAKTFLGACLDPIADKLLLVSFFFTLVFLETPLFSVPLWFVIAVLCKELLIIGGVAFILLSGRHLDVRATLLSKATTVVQMLFIIWLFACYYFHWMPLKTYYLMFGIMLCMIILSFMQYVRIGLEKIYSKEILT